MAGASGDPVPGNLATGATPFSNGDFGGIHVRASLNDQMYGNSFSWIGSNAAPFGGIDLGAVPVANVQSIAFGRSNVLTGDPCGGGVCTDRHVGLYTLQYTQVGNPSGNLGLADAADPTVGWATIGTLNYGASDGPGTNYNSTWQRHRYNFAPVAATGLRLKVAGGTALDEIELYDTAGAVVPPPPPPSALVITPAAGFTISWDGNDGAGFNPASPAPVPDNLALASNGATPFSSGELGPELGIGFHRNVNINDGLYGNSNSWIGASNDTAPFFVGVDLGGLSNVTSVAWGRDNGNGAFDDSDPGTDCCGGQADDRSLGVYEIQVTTDANPGPDSQWTSVGTLDYRSSVDVILGGGFTTYFRHEFDIATDGGGSVLATGVRVLVPASGLGGGGTAIDELEVYASQIPEPTSVVLALLAAIGMLTVGRRNRRRLA